MNNCQICNKKTLNPKFCSKSCSAIYNNKKYPKREKELHNLCKKCNSKLKNSPGCRKTDFCQKCYKNNKNIEYNEKTLENVIIEGLNKKARHKYELVRQHAKRIVKTYSLNKTCKCGYNKHTELCHIKPIHSFDKKSKLKEINSKENLIYLCPNCHWEHDNK